MENEQFTAAYRPLADKEILLGISGGIAAYKAADYLRKMKALGAKVQVVMTESATRFVSPLTFEALSGRPVYHHMFPSGDTNSMLHIDLARKADLFAVLPATANVLAKASNGLADNLLLATILCHSRPVLFFPSMNPAMYANPATVDNIKSLREYGHKVIEPETGKTACGECGKGRLPDWPLVKEAILGHLSPKDLKGLKVLVASGPTREPIDPVRFVSNRSSGKMGAAMALVASRRGGDVTLVTGPVSLNIPPVVEIVNVETARQMADVVKKRAEAADIIIMAAAVSDYAPNQTATRKLKKSRDKIELKLVPTEDILSSLLLMRRPGQIIVGFCAETGNLLENSLEKIRRKPVDILVANDVSLPGVGFDVETNKVMIINKDEERVELPLLHKEEVAERIWDYITAHFIDT